MVFLAFFNFILIISIFGYSYLLKLVLSKSSNNYISNLDFFYGLFLLFLISLVAHIFIPLSYISNFIILIGIILFCISILKKKFKVSLVKYFFIIFIFSIIAYYGVDNVDSPLYHLQIVKWLYNHKLTFGLANLEYRLGVNYPWYSIITLINFEIFQFSNKYYVSILIFSFLLYEILSQKIVKKSFIFLSLAFSYLFIFSLIHPYNYGVVLNHIGNPEKDLFNMCLFIFAIYLILKIDESENISNNINIISISFIVFTMLIMQMVLYSFLFPIFIFLFYKFVKLTEHFKLLTCIVLITLLWLFKSVAINGCLIFPISFTCLNTDWTIDISFLNYMVDETKRYSRSLPSLEMLNDYYKTLETFLWVKPWFKNYFLQTAMHQINLIIFIFSLVFIFFLVLKKKYFISFFDIILITSILLVNFVCILMIPEIRYYWGPHISISVIILTTIICSFNYKFLKNVNFYNLVTILSLSFFLIFKVLPMSKFKDLTKLPERKHNYTSKKKIGIFNGYEIFTNNWQCADINEICVNIPKKNYDFKSKHSFLLILR